MALTYTFDLTTPIGQVRSEIGDGPDDATATLSGTPRATWKCVLADEEITLALTARNGDTLEAGADLCERMAANSALTGALIRIGDYHLDTRSVASALRAQAVALRERAQNTPAEAIYTPYNTDYQARELLERALLADLTVGGLL